jgi:hypothetical protein
MLASYHLLVRYTYIGMALNGRRFLHDGAREMSITSAPVVARGTVVVGSSIADNVRVRAPRGTVRGLDARTGSVRWSWDPLVHDGIEAGHANVWAPMSSDEEMGLVFLPTSSPSPDFWGGRRPGNNEHADPACRGRHCASAQAPRGKLYDSTSGRTHPRQRVAVAPVPANGFGSGCVGDSCSPSAAPCRTGRSSTGQTGWPVALSSTNRNPCLVGWMTTSRAPPSVSMRATLAGPADRHTS